MAGSYWAAVRFDSMGTEYEELNDFLQEGLRRGGMNIEDVLQHRVLLEGLAYSAHIGVAEKDPVIDFFTSRESLTALISLVVEYNVEKYKEHPRSFVPLPIGRNKYCRLALLILGLTPVRRSLLLQEDLLEQFMNVLKQDTLTYEIADGVKNMITSFFVLEENRTKIVSFLKSRTGIFPSCWLHHIDSHPLRDLLATLLKLDFEFGLGLSVWLRDAKLVEGLIQFLTPQNDDSSEAAAHSLFHVIKSAATEDLELCSWPGNERREKTNPPTDSIIYHIASESIFRTLMEIVTKSPVDAQVVASGLSVINLLMSLKSSQAQSWGNPVIDVKLPIWDNLPKLACVYLPALKAQLEIKSTKVGFGRLRILDLIVELLRYPEVAPEISSSGLLPVCCNLLFMFPESNVCHASVHRLIEGSLAIDLLRDDLLNNTQLVSKIIESASAKETSKRPNSISNMGHLILISQALLAATNGIPENKLKTNDAWNDYVNGTYSRAQELLSRAGQVTVSYFEENPKSEIIKSEEEVQKLAVSTFLQNYKYDGTHLSKISEKAKTDARKLVVLKLVLKHMNCVQLTSLASISPIFFEAAFSNEVFLHLLQTDFHVPLEWLSTPNTQALQPRAFFSLYKHIWNSFPLALKLIDPQTVEIRFGANKIFPNVSNHKELGVIKGYISVEESAGWADIANAIVKSPKVEWGWTTNVGRISAVEEKPEFLRIQMEILIDSSGQDDKKNVACFVPSRLFHLKFRHLLQQSQSQNENQQ